jgi:Protein of unknown function (DUF3558)
MFDPALSISRHRRREDEMTAWGRGIRCAAAVAGATALLAGCGNSGGGDNTTPAASSTTPSTPSLAADAPTGFDGCRLPQSVITEEHLNSDPQSSDNASPPNYVWKGCNYVAYDGDGYGASIRTTNLTVSAIGHVDNYVVNEHLTIDGRQAVSYHTSDETDLRQDCILNVAMKGGGLEILVTNPASHKATGTLAACDIAKKLAGDLVPTLPPAE